MIYLIVKCTSVKNNIYEFYFNGYFNKKKINKIMIYGINEFKKNNTYLIGALELEVENNIGKPFFIKRIKQLE